MGIIIILCFSVLATACHTPKLVADTSKDEVMPKDDVIYPADIQIGDSLNSFIYLNPRQIECPEMTKNDYIEYILWHPEEYDDFFYDENGNPKECKDSEILSSRREIRYYELQAPEGTYTYRVKDKGYLTEDFYVESINFTPP